ncbi:IS4 transposase (plasmid) [Halapricum desulfuricans]|uniref:IS4 transposase n=1 Tax=Halapricum desulfuricans TaxID=2841257 RepID=A0A897NTJ5_9EURY|nr:IS4 transposase [Halapricum desulfuricans]
MSGCTERWATTFRSIAQLVLLDITELYDYPPPDLAEFLYLEAQQPAPSRVTLLGAGNAELCSGF